MNERTRTPLTRKERQPAGTNDWLVAVLLILVAVLLFRLTEGGSTLLNDPEAVPKPPASRGELTFDERTNVNIARQVIPAVVQITNRTPVPRDEKSGQFELPGGAGSGFIWDAQRGYVVTNYHVVQGGDRFNVTLHNNQQCEGVLVGMHPDKDLAVLKLQRHPRLQDVKIGRSNELEVGWKVYAIGSPFGLEHTLTTGIISGLKRDIYTSTNARIIDVIQTDAAIYPGNSGGPLVDSEGRVIGINTAAYPGSPGIGFAVPIDTVSRVVSKLIRYGEIDRIGLGIAMIEDHIVRRMLQGRYVTRQGVLFSDILPQSPAAEAGMIPTRLGPNAELVVGDLIVGINGENIGETADFLRLLDGRRPGDTVRLSIWRDSEAIDLEVTLAPLRPPQTSDSSTSEQDID